MIANDQQYEITQLQAANFRKAIKYAEEEKAFFAPRIHQAIIDGMKSQLDDLEEEIREYEELLERPEK